jgi:acetyltransferase-like isoleucine patch superfamily enzyme
MKERGESKTELQASLTERGKSGLKKYLEVTVGSPNLLFLLKYELLTTLFGPLPGALGLILRKKFFRTLLSESGSNIIFGRNVVLRHPRKIRLGNNVIIDDNCVLDAKGETNEGIFIGDNVMIGRNTVLSCKNGSLKIGDNTNIAMNCFIQSAKTVTIGKNVLIAAYSYIIGGGNHEATRTDIPIIAQGQVVKGVVIEDNVWLGASVKVQDGVTIGRDSIIGTGAVVTKSIPEFSVAVGVPAKVIKKRK